MGLRIYKASAGSGKTYTLAKEYIKIALRSPYTYQHILAITFTVKATQEMKHRILSNLKSMSEGGETMLCEQIVSESQETDFPYTAEHVRKQSGLIYSNILHNYGRFEVSTLDSFFVKTVKSIAKELGLPINFEIELDYDKTMEALVEKLFDEAKHNESLRNWLRNYAEHKMAEDKSWQIKRDILKDGKQVFSEKYHQANEDKVGHIAKEGERGLSEMISEAQAEKNKLDAKMSKHCKKAMELITDAGLSHADFSRKMSFIFENEEKLFKDGFTATQLKAASGEGNWYTQKAKESVKTSIDGIAAGLKDCVDSIVALLPKRNTYDSFLNKIFIYGVLDYLNTLLVSYRDEKNVLLLTDLSALLSKLIGDNDAPFIFEKAGSQYQHIFIDEFQDTSDLQWQNVKPLVLNALSNRDEVLIVGDVKQSIYRWRGGNLNLLLKDIQHDLGAHYSEKSALTLDTNYRSNQAIVEFNNRLFSHLRDNIAAFTGSQIPELYQLAYNEIEQQLKTELSDGYVEVNFVDSDLDYNAELSEWIMASIQEAKASGFEHRDMLVLVETNKNGISIAALLMALGIPILTERSLLLRNSEKVLFLISCARWLCDRSNEVAQSQMLYLYRNIFGIATADLHPTFDTRREDWQETFESTMPDGFLDQIDIWKAKPVYEALEDILFFFGLNQQADAYIQKLQDEVLALMESGETSFEDMLLWWEANKDGLSIGIPESENAIRIMTVHKAKGLESPIVFFPFSSRAYSSKGIFWTDQIPERFAEFKLLPLNFGQRLNDNEFSEAFQKEWAEAILERLNAHYVAFTRPTDRLYVYASFNEKKLKKGLQDGDTGTLEKALLRSLQDLNREAQEADDQNITFRFGSKEKKQADKPSDAIDAKELRAYPCNPYQDKLNLKQGSKRFFELKEKGLESDRQRGLIIHNLLESLDEPAVLAQQIDKLQNEGIIDSQDVAFVKETFDKLMEDKTFQSFFADDWMPFVEREIFSKGNSYRPDRVITKGTAAKVIDYKSERQDKRHHKQVNRYAELLSQMGYTDIEKYLVYTINQEIITVP